MAGLTPRDHTRNVLARMNLASSVPANIDRNNDAQGDNYGLSSARSSDASSFKMTGAPKSPHLGRPGRQAGGRIAGDLIRTRRTPEETAKDIAGEDKVINALAKDREGRAHGGRTKGKTTVNVIIGGQKAMTPPAAPPPMAAPPPPPRPPMPPPGMPPGGMPIGGAPLGAAGAPPPGAPPMLRARGGRIGKQWGGGMGGGMQQPGGMGAGGMGQRPWGGMGGGQQPPAATPPAAGATPPAGGWQGRCSPGVQNFVQQFEQAHPGLGGSAGGTPPTPPAGGWGGGQGQGQGGWGGDRDGDRDGRGGWGGHEGWGGHDRDHDQQQTPTPTPTPTPSATGTDTWANRPPPGQTAQTGMGMGGQDGRQWGRARGGRIEVETAGRHDYGKAGEHSFGKGGTPAQASFKRKFGGGSGLGRMEIARKEK